VTQCEVVKICTPGSIYVNRIAAIAIWRFAGVPVSDTYPNPIGTASIDPGGWVFGRALSEEGTRKQNTTWNWARFSCPKHMNVAGSRPSGVFPNRTRLEGIVIPGNQEHRTWHASESIDYITDQLPADSVVFEGIPG